MEKLVVGLDVRRGAVDRMAEADGSPPQVLGTFPDEMVSLVERLENWAAGDLRCCLRRPTASACAAR